MAVQFINIASYLPAAAEKNPGDLAVAAPCGTGGDGKIKYRRITLEELNHDSDSVARGLKEIGIHRGMRVALMVTPGPDFFALTFGLFKLGAVPVMVDPGIGIKNLGQCLGEAEPEAFIGITKAQVARITLGWAKKSVKIVVTVGRRLFWGGSNLDDIRKKGESPEAFPMTQTRADEIAAILFTSGSTGISKGAVYTHEIFDNQVKSIRDVYGIEPGEMDLATFPLFALFGPALGMAAVIPEMDASRPAEADPRNIISAALEFNTTNMFASPALIEKVGRYGAENNIKLPSIRRVISAGAPASPQSVERFSKMLNPGVEIFTPYGATEALPVCSIGSDEILGETGKMTEEGRGSCIGKPVPGMTVKIIKIIDEPIKVWSNQILLPDGEIGEMAVSGPVVSRQYHERPKETVMAKIIDTASGKLYHRMGDVGYRDEKGRFWFCGRKSHRVVTPEGTYFTIPCERIFNCHPDVFRTALVGVQKDGKMIPVLCVELERTARMSNRDKIRKELLEMGQKYGHTRGIKTVLFHPSFPVDIRHNAKIFREKLTVWARSKVK